MESVELRGVYDLVPDKAERVASEYKTRAFKSGGELLGQVQAVSIATSAISHHEVAKQGLQAGIHVLIEKPLCNTVQQAEELVCLAEKMNLIIQVGHIERYNPAVLALQQMVPEIKPMFIEAHRLAAFTERGTDVAVILDLMTHDLDLVTGWVDTELVELQAAGVSVMTDSDDIANARLTFANGCVANVTASRVSAKGMRKIRLFQKDLYASLDLAEKSLELYRLETSEQLKEFNPAGSGLKFELPVEKLGKTIVYEKPPVENQDMLTVQLSAFLESVKSGRKPLVDGRQGAKVVKLAEQIEQKIKEERARVRI
jgi:predicted dehydrogenase